MGTICPKCHYERKPQDAGPDYECPSCGVIYAKVNAAVALANSVARARATGSWVGIPPQHVPPEHRAKAAAQLIATTTPFVPGREVAQVLDVVGAECAFGINVVRDVGAAITDTLGGRAAGTEAVLRDARAHVMAQLRANAFALGAEAIIGVAFDFSEFSGGGKSMLFAVATGTAVSLK